MMESTNNSAATNKLIHKLTLPMYLQVPLFILVSETWANTWNYKFIF